jgi:uncharacterized repeat protein (TIGR01451 family)
MNNKSKKQKQNVNRKKEKGDQMKNVNKILLTGVALLMSLTAHAETASATVVSNTATVDFEVSSVNQPDVTSAAATFVVDRKVNFTVAEVGGANTTVVPGQNAAYTLFTVTNNSNETLDFGLGASNQVGGAAPHSGTDNFNPSANSVFVDANNNGVYDSGTDTATFIDELAGNGASKNVFIVSNISNAQVNDDVAAVILTATAKEGGTATTEGSTVTETAGAEDKDTKDTVFADGDGDNDIARDGKHADTDAYKVITATILIDKISKVVSDPLNGTTNPKRIPGAVVEYIIRVQNTGAVAANSLVITDTIPAELAFLTTFDFDTVQGSTQAIQVTTSDIYSTASSTVTSTVDGDGEDADSTGVDENTIGANFTGSVMTANINTLAASGTHYIRFRTTVQ